MNGLHFDLSKNTYTRMHPLPGDLVWDIAPFRTEHVPDDPLQPARIGMSIKSCVLLFLIFKIHHSLYLHPSLHACRLRRTWKRKGWTSG